MVTKNKSPGQKEAKQGSVKVGKLKLNKQTVKDLTGSESKQIKGGGLHTAGTQLTQCRAACALK